MKLSIINLAHSHHHRGMSRQTQVACCQRQPHTMFIRRPAFIRIALHPMGNCQCRIRPCPQRLLLLWQSRQRFLGQFDGPGCVAGKGHKAAQHGQEFYLQRLIFWRRRQGTQQIFFFLERLGRQVNFFLHHLDPQLVNPQARVILQRFLR